MEEKIGGYDAKLTRRTREMQEENIAYSEGYEEGQAEHFPENAELAKEVLASIDLTVLKGIFHEYLQKCGVPVENANDAVLDKIFVYPSKTMVAAYSSFENTMAFSTSDEQFLEAKRHKAEQLPIPAELLMKMHLFFIHEACHVFSRNRLYSVDSETPRSRFRQESGYHIGESTYNEHTDEPAKKAGSSFEAFNEGVTQRIAEEVFLAYQQRIGQSGTGRQVLSSSIREWADLPWRYSIYCNQIDSMCESIAEYTGVPKEEVWKSFKRGYFEKPELFHEETVKFFEETFGKDFLDEYGKIGNTTSLRDIGRFDAQHRIADQSEYAEKWLRHLGISKG